MTRADADAFAGSHEARVQIATPRVERGSYAAKHRGDDGDGKRRRQRNQAEVNVDFFGHRVRRHDRVDPAQARVREETTECRASESQDETFSEKLAYESAARSAERGADREFLFARCGTSEQQIRYIGACDQKK